MPEFHDDPALPAPAFPGSHVVVDDDYLFLSGLLAADIGAADVPIGDVASETELVMKELRRTLGVFGCGLDRVVRVDVHLADLGEIDTMDAIYRGFFEPGRYPARTCTESPRLFGGCRVEITLMARRA